jgi:phosphatidylinositol glycan class B
MSQRRRPRAAAGYPDPPPSPEKARRIRTWPALGSGRRVLALALALRAANALLVRTYFNPDEH